MPIVYFDGECNVCNGFVDFLLRHDRRHVYRFTTLQGTTAAERLPPEWRSSLSTMVLEKDGEYSTESTGALKTLAGLGGVYSLAILFLIVPRFARDFVYRWISRNRFRWFGRRDQCRIPTPAERDLFLP